MQKNNYRFLLILFFISLCSTVNAQDHSFSQPFLNQLYLNPAYTGVNRGLRIGFNYRNQWTRVPRKLETFNLALDIQSIQTLSGGIGLLAYRNVEGEGFLATNSVGALYAYHLLVSKNFNINFGAYSGMMMKTIDWSRLQFTDQFDPVQGLVSPISPGFDEPVSESAAFLDVAGGILFRFNIPFDNGRKSISNEIGYSAWHINRADESLIGGNTILPFKQIAHLNIWFPVSQYNSQTPPLYLSPKLVYEQQGSFKTFISSLYIQRSPVFGGFSYRNRQPFNTDNTDAYTFHVGVNGYWDALSSIYIIAYSYDFNVTGLGSASAGVHEVSLVFTFEKARLSRRDANNKSRRSTKCFSFGENLMKGGKKGIFPHPIY